jgi:hypothetical protein
MQTAIISIIGLLVRHGLTAAGTAGLAIGDGDAEKVVAAVAIVAGLIWSFVQKKRSGSIPPKES